MFRFCIHDLGRVFHLSTAFITVTTILDIYILNNKTMTKGVKKMKITCQRNMLSEALQVTQKGMASNNTIPHLNGFYITADENGTITIKTFDLEMGIEYYFETQVMDPGAIVAPGKFLDIIRKLPEQEVTISVDMDNFLISIESGQAFFEIRGLSAEEYPKLPTIEETDPLSLPQSAIKEMIHQTHFAVSKEETKPAFTGVLFKFNEQNHEMIDMIATDSYRLAWKKGYIINQTHLSGNFIVPEKAVSHITRIIDHGDQHVKIYLTDQYFLCETDRVKLFSKLIDEEFPNLDQVIPKNYQTRVRVEKGTLLDSMERASLLASEGSNNIVKLNITEGNMEITSNSPQTGKLKEDVFVDKEGDNLSIALNSRFLIDVLKVLKEEQVELEFTGSYSPVILRPEKNDDYFHLILPVRAF